MKKIYLIMMAVLLAIACGTAIAACGTIGKKHEHNWSATYIDDGGRHYQTCDGCDEKKYSDHEYGVGDVCACGKIKPAEFRLGSEGRDDKEYYIVKLDGTTYTSIEIPSTYDGQTVKKIGKNGFEKCPYLKKVVIADGITEIGKNAFSECPELETVVLPKSIETIGEGAFAGCGKLKNVNFENIENPTSLAMGCFLNCTSLESVALPKNMSVLPAHTFDGCKSLKNIELHEGLTDIGEGAFKNCDSLESIVLPQSLNRIGNMAFYCCRSLYDATVKNESVYVGDNVMSGSRAVVLRFTAASGGDAHFYKWGESLPVVWDCEKNNIGYDENKNYGCEFDFVDGIMYKFNGDVAAVRPQPLMRTKAKTVVPSAVEHAGKTYAVTEISPYAFAYSLTSMRDPLSGESKLEEIVVPDSVAKIGEYAFENCDNLVSATLPAELETVPEGLFNRCLRLTDADIPSGVTKIEYGAFGGCENLSEAALPSGLTELGGAAFSGCTSLETLVVPDGVTNFGDNAFSFCPLKDVTISAAGFSKLTEENKTEIRHLAFSSGAALDVGQLSPCKKLRTLDIPATMTDIDFDAISALSVWRQDGLRYDFTVAYVSVDENNPRFSSRDGIVYNKDMTQFVYIPIGVGKDVNDNDIPVVIPDTITEIPERAFVDRLHLSEIVFSDKLTAIGGRAFSKEHIGCFALHEIVIPESVRSIGWYAFMGANLMDVTLNNGLTKIGSGAFDDCELLTEIKFNGTVTEWNGILKEGGGNISDEPLAIVCTDGRVSTPTRRRSNGITASTVSQ